MRHRREQHGSATKEQEKEIDQIDSTCNMCSKVFATKKYLTKHLKTHQPTDPKSNLTCNVCDKTFARTFTLSRHLDIAHSTRISKETNVFLLEKNEEKIKKCINVNSVLKILVLLKLI